MVDIAYPIKTIMNFPLLHLEERWFGYFFSVLTLHDCIAAVLEQFQLVVFLHFLNLWAFSPLCCTVPHSASLLLFLLKAWWIIAFVVSLHLAAALPQRELPSVLR